MKKRFFKVTAIFLLFALLFGCRQSSKAISVQLVEEVKASEVEQNSNLQDTLAQNKKEADDPFVYLDDLYLKEGTQKYNEYEFAIKEKEVQVKDVSHLSPVAYVVVKKNGRTLAKFDRLRYSLGTYARFALFNFISNADKQLIVEQTIHRGWAYWIAALSPNFLVIFSSEKYDLYGDLLPLDIEKDGVYEFEMALTTFWFFDGLCGACSPRIPIIFKYDKGVKEYLPASHLFADRALKDIESHIARVHEVKSKPEKEGGNQMAVYSAVLYVVVEYLYAGKEKEAWGFFDREYNFQDKQQRKASIKGALKNDSVYKIIYRGK